MEIICIFEKKAVPSHQKEVNMIITELKELTQILYFEGEYALFRAKDEVGMYRGIINRKGEIVWNVKWRHIMMRIHGFPNLFKTITDDKEKGYVYFDVEKLDFVDESIVTELLKFIDEGKKSKAQQKVDETAFVSFFDGMPDLFSYKPLCYLSDEYLGFTSTGRHWGVQDLEGNIILSEVYYNVKEGGEPNHFVATLEDRDMRKKNKVGVIDDQGEWIIPPIYDSMHWRRAYYVAYIKEPRKKRKCGLLDKHGNILVPFEYDFLDPSYSEDLISAKKGRQFLFINSKNERINLL